MWNCKWCDDMVCDVMIQFNQIKLQNQHVCLVPNLLRIYVMMHKQVKIIAHNIVQCQLTYF